MSEQYEAVIGLEIHVQLATKSKMFCRCDNDSEGAEPNQHTCPVCLGLPGTLPVPNRTAVEWAIKTAAALGCAVPEVSKFDRKQYFYPDLPKGYQISQYDQPLGGPGQFEFDVDGESRTVGITRLHLEEDAGKLTHPKGADYSLVDLNRAGTPLMEIVTEPDFRSPAEARAFLQELRTLVRFLGVSDADMEKGHLRADANVSVRPAGQKELGTKAELKNLNSFKFVEKGLESEIARQTEVLSGGGTVVQETRGFVEATGGTVSQRGKEEAQDYRYFPEPDIPPLRPHELVDKAGLPGGIELPVARKRRWRSAGVQEDAIGLLAESREAAEQFDRVAGNQAKEVAKIWVSLKDQVTEVTAFADFCAAAAAELAAGRLSFGQVGKLYAKAQDKPVAEVLATDPEFKPVDEGALAKVVDEAIVANPKAVADYQAGNQNAQQAIIGYVMKQTKGSANPTTVTKLLQEKL